MLVSAMTPRIAPRLTNAGRQSLRTRGDLSMMKTSSRKYIRVVTDIDDTVKVSGSKLNVIYLIICSLFASDHIHIFRALVA